MDRYESDCDGEDVAAGLLARARTGDAAAFESLVAPYRRELHVHCYRILGSIQDAEDAVQETLLSAWQGLGGFEGRAALRTWLYRVATNRSLDALRAGARRPVAVRTVAGVEPPEPSRISEVTWLQPYPDVLLDELPDDAPGPDAVAATREAISLAFITALQLLPPLQRAVLILRDVLGYRASEAAYILDTTEDSVTSALKRARATLRANAKLDRQRGTAPAAGSAEEQRIVQRFVEAFTAHDVPGIVAMLSEDAWVKMPPMPFEYQGRAAAGRFFAAITPPPGRKLRVIHTRANRQPAFAAYVADTTAGAWRPVGIIVLTVAGDLISEVIRFDVAVLASFGLPRILPDDPVASREARSAHPSATAVVPPGPEELTPDR
ncbi:RNA polymerase subunit sigma-70 [Mycobacterium terramassiliense]|uniref:DNA-directed RNA polymerase sigma-70 factor n=1 Tax=Mycobacterium terramassiliense TaxID=1841859 RepID=A0A2U3NH61_9MYCO|nr:RNA polymerase subunit sigma-70 [Mycobacterium terramassiliense]SPM30820.1 DNA-directed RNA polymerase sigma-70 factor [Mycobacterium terramassiliense]